MTATRGKRWLFFAIVSELGVFLLIADDSDKWAYKDFVDSATTLWTLALLALVVIFLLIVIYRTHAGETERNLETLFFVGLVAFVVYDGITADPNAMQPWLLHLHHEWIEVIAIVASAASYVTVIMLNRAPRRAGADYAA